MSEPDGKDSSPQPLGQGPVAPVVLEVEPDDWQRVCAPWQVALEATARETHAVQRKRKLRSAVDLLRLALAYSQCDWSLQQLGAWATAMQVSAAPMSNTALQARLRGCRAWLSLLVGRLLKHVPAAPPAPGLRVRLIDATVICQPGSRGTDWRVHLSWNAGTLSVDSLEVTDAHGGESLARHAAQAGDVGVADRGYARSGGLGDWLVQGADVVVRSNGHDLALETAPAERLDVRRWLQGLLPSTRQATCPVWVTTPSGRFGLRLIAQRLPDEVAAAARRRLQATSRKKGRTCSDLSLFMAGWVVLLTTLPEALWPVDVVLGLYRLRWQVELVIKRAKSLLNLDHLRAHDPELVQVYLLGKLVGWLLLDGWTRQQAAQLADWFDVSDGPLSVWRWTALCADQLRALVRGPFTLQRFLAALPKLKRYLHDRPRKRPQQLAHARRFLLAFGLNPLEALNSRDLAALGA